VDAYLDRLLDELVTVEPREEWQNVLARARRSRRRYVVAAAVVAALILAPTTWAIAQAFEGTPAPRSVKSDFRFSNQMRAQIARTLGRKQPKAIVRNAHGVIQVHTADGPLDLWAAPATDGGTCYLIDWQPGPNNRLGATSSSCVPPTPAAAGVQHDLEWGSESDYQHRNYNVIHGYAWGRARIVQLTLSNGKTKTFPVVEGLFLGALHQSLHWRQRAKIISLTARTAHGHIVGYWRRAAR
jgi:hypothetical protein